jgi:hypothetical protein
MSDPRWDQLADILVNYSTGIKPGEKVQITMLEVGTFRWCAVCGGSQGWRAARRVQSAYLSAI